MQHSQRTHRQPLLVYYIRWVSLLATAWSRRPGRWMRTATEDTGQSEWVGQIMILGIVVLIAVAVFAFWKAGGLTWVNNQLNSITSY